MRRMVIELRQYLLSPGMRDVLVELFERELLEPQEQAGMRIVGQFRDRDRPDHFVWIREFPSMAARAEALRAFYGGPVWRAHRAAANATMIDSDDVLLLRPVHPGSGFPPVGSPGTPAGTITATICQRRTPIDDAFLRRFEREVVPALREAGAPPLACFHTETADNDFPALPVRTGEHVLVWFARRLTEPATWAALAPELLAAPQQLRLEPTPRSALR